MVASREREGEEYWSNRTSTLCVVFVGKIKAYMRRSYQFSIIDENMGVSLLLYMYYTFQSLFIYILIIFKRKKLKTTKSSFSRLSVA